MPECYNPRVEHAPGPYSYIRRKRRRPKLTLPGCLALLFGIVAVALLVYQVPFVKQHLGWRIDDLVTRVKQTFNPPEEAVFDPIGLVDPAVITTSHPTSTPSGAEGTPVPTFEPLPPSVILDGITFVSQQDRWNYCGPSNLTMALNYWGWPGNRDDVAMVVKPGEDNPNMTFVERGKKDKNVMPYELEDFVNEDTEFRALTRIGGDIQLIKRMIAHGFPVLIEKGYYEADYRGIVDWLGHYLFVTGYDDGRDTFIVQDAWDKNHPGENVDSPYDQFIEGWRSFNYLFMIVYPTDREAEVLELLGPWADPDWANQHALQVAEQEASTLDGIDQYFAWFNTGSSHVALYEYVDAANAYDYAFQLYNALDDETYNRPYRMTWYQTGPYFAYYYARRYQDVINLADKTLNDWSGDTLEESIYWRGMARLALGETDNAIDDFKETVYLNPNFSPGQAMLQELGVSQ